MQRLILICLLCAPLTTACAGAGAAVRNTLQVDSQDQAALHSAAETWWRDVRWQRSASARAYIEKREVRSAFVFWVEDQKSVRRITDVNILDVILDEPLDETKDGREREAQVLVRLEAHTLPAMTSGSEQVTQNWYRTQDGWFVEWEPPEEQSETTP